MLRVPANSEERCRGHRVKKVQADEVHPGRLPYHSAFVNGFAIFAEDGKVDPRETGMITRTPDHILHFEGATAFE
jgi:hypothetical protein